MANSTRSRHKQPAETTAAEDSGSASKQGNKGKTPSLSAAVSNAKRNGANNTNNSVKNYFSSSAPSNKTTNTDISTEDSHKLSKGSLSPSSALTLKRYKVVTDQSTNQRSCLRANRELEQSSTPNRDNSTSVSTTFRTQATLKLTLPGSTNPSEQLANVVREVLRE